MKSSPGTPRDPRPRRYRDSYIESVSGLITGPLLAGDAGVAGDPPSTPSGSAGSTSSSQPKKSPAGAMTTWERRAERRRLALRAMASTRTPDTKTGSGLPPTPKTESEEKKRERGPVAGSPLASRSTGPLDVEIPSGPLDLDWGRKSFAESSGDRAVVPQSVEMARWGSKGKGLGIEFPDVREEAVPGAAWEKVVDAATASHTRAASVGTTGERGEGTSMPGKQAHSPTSTPGTAGTGVWRHGRQIIWNSSTGELGYASPENAQVVGQVLAKHPAFSEPADKGDRVMSELLDQVLGDWTATDKATEDTQGDNNNGDRASIDSQAAIKPNRATSDAVTAAFSRWQDPMPGQKGKEIAATTIDSKSKSPITPSIKLDGTKTRNFSRISPQIPSPISPATDDASLTPTPLSPARVKTAATVKAFSPAVSTSSSSPPAATVKASSPGASKSSSPSPAATGKAISPHSPATPSPLSAPPLKPPSRPPPLIPYSPSTTSAKTSRSQTATSKTSPPRPPATSYPLTASSAPSISQVSTTRSAATVKASSSSSIVLTPSTSATTSFDAPTSSAAFGNATSSSSAVPKTSTPQATSSKAPTSTPQTNSSKVPTSSAATAKASPSNPAVPGTSAPQTTLKTHTPSAATAKAPLVHATVLTTSVHPAATSKLDASPAASVGASASPVILPKLRKTESTPSFASTRQTIPRKPVASSSRLRGRPGDKAALRDEGTRTEPASLPGAESTEDGKVSPIDPEDPYYKSLLSRDDASSVSPVDPDEDIAASAVDMVRTLPLPRLAPPIAPGIYSPSLARVESHFSDSSSDGGSTPKHAKKSPGTRTPLIKRPRSFSNLSGLFRSSKKTPKKFAASLETISENNITALSLIHANITTTYLTSREMSSARRYFNLPPLTAVPYHSADTHPGHPFGWYASKLHCTHHQQQCSICGASCCVHERLEHVESLGLAGLQTGGRSDVDEKLKKLKGLSTGVTGIESFETFLKCTQCGKTVCPACISYVGTDAARDLLCKICKSQ
ncbi:hypothetical protein CAC42_6567 [Sphaceloma murrayae]|uniref:Uncharacterized protein n=1 Tax=Sphaceloma murrayae TaxID=2082308 RepID=A0A2K1QFU5_9PEZI|nr:hypothetical protein CAC42_6567 [Sphaceloma murrayae]